MPRPAPPASRTALARTAPPRRIAGRTKDVAQVAAKEPPPRSRKAGALVLLLRWGFIGSVWLTLAAAIVVLWYLARHPPARSRRSMRCAGQA